VQHSRRKKTEDACICKADVGASTLAVSIKKDRETGERDSQAGRQAGIDRSPPCPACLHPREAPAGFISRIPRPVSLSPHPAASYLYSFFLLCPLLLSAGFFGLSS